MKKRIFTFITAFVLAVSLSATTVSAAVCPISNCGAALVTIYEGDTDSYSATHKYGGIFGLFQNTCYYYYYYSIYSQECARYHIVGSYTIKYETGHDCY